MHAYLPFGMRLSAHLVVRSHICWACHPAQPSDHLDADSQGDSLTAISIAYAEDTVSRASDRTNGRAHVPSLSRSTSFELSHYIFKYIKINSLFV